MLGVLLELIQHPDQLQLLRADAPLVPTIERQARVVRDHYVALRY
jgi:hypothetical protein